MSEKQEAYNKAGKILDYLCDNTNLAISNEQFGGVINHIAHLIESNK